MTTPFEVHTPKPRYGPVTFVSAMLNIFVVNLSMWICAPYTIILYQIYLFVLADLGLSIAFATRAGNLAQIGRGMLIGLLSVPAALVAFASVFIIAHAIGPI